MSAAEQNFRESLRAFNSSTGRGGTTSSSSPFSFTSYFQGSGSTTAADPAAEGLLGGFRTRTQNAFSNLGWGTQEQELLGLTRWQRLVGFIVCLGLGILCFTVAFMTLPLLAIRPAKFATLYTLGSLLVLTSFALMQGPRAFFRHIFSKDRLPFTGAYLGSMILTLYFAVGKNAYIMTVICSVVQIIALLWYFGSYVPGGVSGLGFMTRYFARNSVGLPV